MQRIIYFFQIVSFSFDFTEKSLLFSVYRRYFENQVRKGGMY